MKRRSQLAVLRSFTGKKRLEIAFELSDMTWEFALANIKLQNPKANKRELIGLLVERLYRDPEITSLYWRQVD